MRAFEVFENVPLPQVAHTRSLVSVPSVAMYWPGVHLDQPLQAVPGLLS